MARKHRNGAVQAPLPSPTGYDPIPDNIKLRWHNPSLTTQDKQWLEGHPNELTGLVAGMLQELEPGFVFSLKYGLRDGSWIATIVCQDANHNAAGQAISVRGSTSARAAIVLAYHLAAFGDDPWWSEGGAASGVDW